MLRYALALLGCCLVSVPLGCAQTLESQLKDAITAQQKGDTSEAIRLYQQVLQQRPDLAQIRSNLGAALAREGRLAEAIEQYTQALQSLPGNSGITLNLALAHYKLGHYRDAAGVLEPLVSKDPNNIQAAEILADCWNQMGQSAKSIELLTPLERAHREDRGIAFLLGTALLNEGRTAFAELVLNPILKDDNSAEAQLLLGAGKLNARDFLSAIPYFKRAMELNPKLPLVHAYYGRALMATGDTAAAAGEFRAELARNPFDFLSNLQLALLLKQEGKTDEALKCAEAALRVRPNDPGALYQVASLHILEGKNEEALGELERLTKQSPQFTEAQVSLATVYYRLKRREDGDRVRAVVRKLKEQEQQRQMGTEQP